MSKYDNYGQFLLSVVELSEKMDLTLFPNNTVKIDSERILNLGWDYFASITVMISRPELNERDYISLANNSRLIVPTLKAGIDMDRTTASSELIMNLHEFKEFPLAIKEVGLKYIDRYEGHEGERLYLDALKEEVANELVRLIKQIKQ